MHNLPTTLADGFANVVSNIGVVSFRKQWQTAERIYCLVNPDSRQKLDFIEASFKTFVTICFWRLELSCKMWALEKFVPEAASWPRNGNMLVVWNVTVVEKNSGGGRGSGKKQHGSISTEVDTGYGIQFGHEGAWSRQTGKRWRCFGSAVTRICLHEDKFVVAILTLSRSFHCKTPRSWTKLEYYVYC